MCVCIFISKNFLQFNHIASYSTTNTYEIYRINGETLSFSSKTLHNSIKSKFVEKGQTNKSIGLNCQFISKYPMAYLLTWSHIIHKLRHTHTHTYNSSMHKNMEIYCNIRYERKFVMGIEGKREQGYRFKWNSHSWISHKS